jgi:hypothetical protein
VRGTHRLGERRLELAHFVAPSAEGIESVAEQYPAAIEDVVHFRSLFLTDDFKSWHDKYNELSY